jgi:hypothetical protein
MKYDKLTPEEIESYENHLIEKADRLWVEMYGKEETTDTEKLKLYSREGLTQDIFEHDLIVGYFKKQGLWKDGRTTLKEREIQLTLKRTKFGEKIARIRDSKIGNINDIIKKAKAQKAELEAIPVRLKEEYRIDKNAILENLSSELIAFYERAENDIEKEVREVYDDFIQTIRGKQGELIKKARNELGALQKHQKNRIRTEVEIYSAELEAELLILDNYENDENRIKGLEEEIKLVNEEIGQLRNFEPTEDLPIEAIKIKPKVVKEMFVCPFCPEEDKRQFGNKGGLGSHIKGKHGDEKFEEYKNLQKAQEVVAE